MQTTELVLNVDDAAIAVDKRKKTKNFNRLETKAVDY
jgi:hypothetical protein